MINMKNFLNFFLKQGVLLNIIFVGMIIFSASIAIPNLPVEQYPNFAFGEVQITTLYPGATPEEIERLVTQHIEDSLRGMENIEYVKSTSQANRSMISLKFTDDTNYDELYDELRFRVMGIQNQLPTQNGDPLTPHFAKVDVDEWLPLIQVNLVSSNPQQALESRTLTLLAKELRLRLEKIDQIKKVLIIGDSASQYSVALDTEKLEKHRITLQEIQQAMRNSGRAPPSGSLNTNLGENLIRIDNRYRSQQDIFDLPVRRDGHGNILYLGELVDPVNTGIEKIQGHIISSVNGLDTAACKVLKLDSGNSFKIKEDVKSVVNEFLKTHAEYPLKAIYTLDSTNKIRDGLGVLSGSLMLSSIFVMSLLFLFLAKRSKRLTIIGMSLGLIATLIVGFYQSTLIQAITIGVLSLFVMLTCRAAILTLSGIIFSFLGSLSLFYISGQSINELTLLGFVLVSGIVVDDAIVVIENIQRHRESGKTLREAVLDGTAEVFWPVFSATLTTMAAFMPLLLMTGSVGDFFALIPIAVTIALAISLIECLILLPLHFIDLETILGKEKNADFHSSDSLNDFLNRPGILGRISRLYHKALSWALKHPALSIGSSGILFVIAIFILIMPFIGFPPVLKLMFFPDNTSVVQVYLRMPSGTSLEKTDQKIREIGRHLIQKGPNQILNTTSQSGILIDLDYKPVISNQYAFMMAELPLKKNRSFDDAPKFISAIRRELEEKFEKDGVDLDIIAAKDGPPVGLPINIRVAGLEDENIMKAVRDIMTYLNEQSSNGKKFEGIIDLKHDRMNESRLLSFDTSRSELAKLDLPEIAVQQFLADSLDGAYIADYRRIDEDIPLKLKLSPDQIRDPIDLLNVPIINEVNGKQVLFGDVGKMTYSTIPSALIRWDFQRIVTITGNLSEDTKIGAINISNHMENWWKSNRQNYPGVELSFGGESESTGKSYRSLATAFLIALVLIYAILASQFQSYLQPLLIMSNIMFSFTGVILVMALLGLGSELLPEGMIRSERSYFTVNGFMAIVGLTGLVVNDAIVLINFMNHRIKDGLPLQEALLMAGHQRMRPILMTTLTTIAGLLPMAIGIPEFSIAWSPFATSFIAGLTVSTAMTLLVLPVLFKILYKWTHKNKQKFNERRTRKSAQGIIS